MSGTSLDGVDIAFCVFKKMGNQWLFEIQQAETIQYDEVWKEKLNTAHLLSGEKLTCLNVEYGAFLGQLVVDFVSKYDLNPDMVSSHGHTVFHQPDKGVTLQIGSGAAIASTCNIPVVCDFRTTDIANGGQGAPLVPIGDKLLFSEFDMCLNIGGFSNISFEKNGNRLAFDISPANIVLNHLCSLIDKLYDENGQLAAQGKRDETLFKELNTLSFYKKSFPKSLGREWVEKQMLPIINHSEISVIDKIRTVTEHIAFQMANAINSINESGNVLATGGGAYNTFLIEILKTFSKSRIHIPENKLIDFKESLIFAFLGVLRIRNETNCLQSVTGAKKDSSAGCVYLN